MKRSAVRRLALRAATLRPLEQPLRRVGGGTRKTVAVSNQIFCQPTEAYCVDMSTTCWIECTSVGC